MKIDSIINNITIGLGILITATSILILTGVAIGRLGYPLIFTMGTLFCLLNGILYYRQKKWIGILLFIAAAIFLAVTVLVIIRLMGQQ
ncbi:MAG: hypothetical protein K6F99_07625 [Lachnospiraceae bacterium]|nr:hypothetical protein [Lachnospiraceae bacterium]